MTLFCITFFTSHLLCMHMFTQMSATKYSVKVSISQKALNLLGHIQWFQKADWALITLNLKLVGSESNFEDHSHPPFFTWWATILINENSWTQHSWKEFKIITLNKIQLGHTITQISYLSYISSLAINTQWN